MAKQEADAEAALTASDDEARAQDAGGDQIVPLEVDRIVPSPFQPRTHIAPGALDELASSLSESGLLQPIVVRPLEDGFELVTGERRWRAAQQLGWQTIPAIVRPLSDEAAGALAMIENLQREDLTAVEEALGYRRLLQQFGWTQEELGRRIGKSQSAIANKLRLLRLPEEVLERVGAHGLTERHARALLRLPDEATQAEMAASIEKYGWKVDEAERRVEAWLQRQHQGDDHTRTNRRVVRVFKDMRLFRNSIMRVVEDMQRTGLDVAVAEAVDRDGDPPTWEIKLTVRKVEGRDAADG